MRGRFRLSPAEVSVLLSFFAYAALFIYKSSFTIGGVRYFSLFDDDMISMRYAANLARHQGLVWNPGGKRTLGFTNPLWVLYMSLFHLLPIPRPKTALCIQASGAAFLACSLFFVKGIAQKLFPERRFVAALAMLLVGFYGPLANWCLQGTEVSALTLFVAASVWLSLRSLEGDWTPFGLYALLGVSTLCRMDMAVVAGSILLSLALLQPRRWKRHLVIGGSVVLAFLLIQMGLNFLYYNDLLPNTYYLKMTGYPLWGRVRRGIFVELLFVFPLLPLVWLVLRHTPRTCDPRAIPIFAAALAGQLLYSVWVGGDAWEWWGGANRYVAIVMPLFLVLLAAALVHVSGLMEHTPAAATSQRVRLAAQFKLAVLIVVVPLLADLYHLPNHLLLAEPLETARPQSPCNEDMVRQALLVRSLTDKDATIAVVWAGALPYFAERRAIDLLGKNDEKIAKEPMHVESNLAQTRGFWPGHLKWDYRYSIGQLNPDVVVQLWAVEGPELPWLRTKLRSEYVAITIAGYRWYVRRASPHFRWNVAAALH